MFSWPRKCVRRIRPVSYKRAKLRSARSPRIRDSRLPRFPRIRRRLPYTACCWSRLPHQLRRPQPGSLMQERISSALRSLSTPLL